jgi:hypothetical protein
MNEQKEIKARLVKCLLELVILQLLKENEMHGYQIIKSPSILSSSFFSLHTLLKMVSIFLTTSSISSTILACNRISFARQQFPAGYRMKKSVM